MDLWEISCKRQLIVVSAAKSQVCYFGYRNVPEGDTSVADNSAAGAGRRRSAVLGGREVRQANQRDLHASVRVWHRVHLVLPLPLRHVQSAIGGRNQILPRHVAAYRGDRKSTRLNSSHANISY